MKTPSEDVQIVRTGTCMQTCTLTNGSIYFSDPDWTNHPARYYRIRSP